MDRIVTSRRDEPRFGLAPAYLLVLLVLAGLGAWAARSAALTHEAARTAGAFPAETRQSLAFQALFDVGVGAILAVAVVLEVLAAVIRLGRGDRPRLRTLVRLAFGLVPAAAWVAGHVLFVPALNQGLTLLRTAIGR